MDSKYGFDLSGGPPHCTLTGQMYLDNNNLYSYIQASSTVVLNLFSPADPLYPILLDLRSEPLS